MKPHIESETWNGKLSEQCDHCDAEIKPGSMFFLACNYDGTARDGLMFCCYHCAALTYDIGEPKTC